MNIFVLDYDIDKCARYHNDRHVVKMITESAQLLSTAVRLSGIDAGYRVTHKNHPCAVWARESLSNWMWLRQFAERLNAEWQHRYGHTRDHGGWAVAKQLPVPNLPDVGRTPFPQAMPEQYRRPDAVQAYRAYYRGDKAHIATWKRRDVPEWFTETKLT